jgi:hypothetical protein
MGDRSMLGPADVSDERLEAMVAESLGVDRVEVVSCQVEVAQYDLETLTTAGRYWVRGEARHPDGLAPYAFFVKVVQSWSRSQPFQLVPEALREIAAASLPWRVEPLVYRSDLDQRLPAGLTIPRAYAVEDLDDLSAAVWMAAVDVDPTSWEESTFERAAYLLGRLAASPAVAPLRKLSDREIVRSYAETRVAFQILPALHNDDLWRQPLVAETFDPALQARLLAAADALPALVDELDLVPLGSAHGDACPRNLLRVPGAPEDFVLIDFGFWCQAPLGFDLSQLLLGELQLGERPAAELPALEDVCLAAYVQGLHDEGWPVDLAVVRRSHALLMLLFWGLSSVPLEVLFGVPEPFPPAVARERAAAATFVLDLVEATAPR